MDSFSELRKALSLPWREGSAKEALARAQQEVDATTDACVTWLSACIHCDSALALSELLFWIGQCKAARARLEATEYQEKEAF